MNLGVQYYRAPFPDQEYWENDFRKIRESGLNTVQLWLLWGWIESKPGVFDFSDYDRLVELAEKNGLQVVLSTIAEIQPLWIFREVPGSEMIDSMGHKVISTMRHECNFGLTPGGCTDHPGVRERMKGFLEAAGKHYRDCQVLHGWDLWNELRWNIQADGLVCFCEHTLADFRAFLQKRYGSLDALNAAWKRRYIDWQDVAPGKAPDRPYQEMMAWEHFITDRADRHGAWRYSILRAADPNHVITAHGSCPTSNYYGNPETYPCDRGNDWNLANALDGIGCSSFPVWGGIDDAEFGSRVEMVHAAANGKHIWLSEVQAGRAGVGFNMTAEVRAAQQQRWIWNGLACGADTILLWCWRDEVFARESGYFGLDGQDEYAPERIAAMRETGNVLTQYSSLFAKYRPEEAQIGIVFSPGTYYLAWAQDGTAKRMSEAIDGYARCLVKRSLNATFLEAEHLENLAHFRLVILPRTIVLSAAQEAMLAGFVESGGTLLVEAECGAFNENGLYRYSEKRFLQRWGIAEAGRRQLAPAQVEFQLGERRFSLECEQWKTPLRKDGAQPARVFAWHGDQPLAAEYHCGKGRVVYLGSYFGNPALQNPQELLGDFLQEIARDAGVTPPFQLSDTDGKFVYVKTGRSGAQQLLFCFFSDAADHCRITLHREAQPRQFTELQTGRIFTPETDGSFLITPAHLNLTILREDI
ncbi:MAG: beta-galactosidase [Victivallales bacterium]|nr:beta-galactosidase [Victivallales bacterium]